MPLGACVEHVPETSGLRGTVGHIGAFSIDPEGQIQLTMVAAHAPLVDPDFLDVLEYPAQLTVEGNGR